MDEKIQELINSLASVKAQIAAIESALDRLAADEALKPVSEQANTDAAPVFVDDGDGDVIDLSLDEFEPAVEASSVPDEVAGPEAPEEPAVVEDGFYGLFRDGEGLDAPEKKTRKKARGNIRPVFPESSGKTVLDAKLDRAAWSHDIPGPEVKSLRSAIALGDQVMYIDRLFRNDSALYQSTIDLLNSMDRFKEAVEYLSSTFPEWDPESEDVYRFMMSVRRKIRR